MFDLIETISLVFIEVQRKYTKIRWAIVGVAVGMIGASAAALYTGAFGRIVINGYELGIKDVTPFVVANLAVAFLLLLSSASAALDRDKLKTIVNRDDDGEFLRAWTRSFATTNYAPADYLTRKWLERPNVDSSTEGSPPAAQPEEDIIQAIRGNLGQLIEYYIMNKSQARNSFNASLFAVILGFITIIVGAYWAYSSGRSDVTAYLVPFAGVILQFIGGAYFYLYNRSLIQLNFFFSRLAQMQDTLLAIHLTESLPDAKDKTKAIDRLITIVAERSTTAPAYLTSPPEKRTPARRSKAQPAAVTE